MFPYPEQYRIATPPITTALMVAWSLLCHALLPDNSIFALYPLFTLFPFVVFSHLYLIYLSAGMSRLDQSFYALVHIPLAFVVWTFCIMLLTGKGIG